MILSRMEESRWLRTEKAQYPRCCGCADVFEEETKFQGVSMRLSAKTATFVNINKAFVHMFASESSDAGRHHMSPLHT